MEVGTRFKVEGKEYVIHRAEGEYGIPVTTGKYVVIIQDLYSGAEVAYNCVNPNSSLQINNLKMTFQIDAIKFYCWDNSQLIARSYLKEEIAIISGNNV